MKKGYHLIYQMTLLLICIQLGVAIGQYASSDSQFLIKRLICFWELRKKNPRFKLEKKKENDLNSKEESSLDNLQKKVELKY